MQRSLLTLILFAGPLLFSLQRASAQEAPAELVPAMKQVTQQRVTDIVTHLASDEMAGRDTPSPQLREAGDYVAGHFKKAGLTGGAKDGTFFQKTEIATTSIPIKSIVFRSDGKDLSSIGMLAAGDEAIAFKGTIPVVDPEAKFKKPFEGPVAIDATDLTGRRSVFRLAQRLGKLVENGATAVVVKSNPASPFVLDAKRAGQPRLVNARRVIRIPTLLVKEFAGGEYELKLPKLEHGKVEVRNVIGMVKGSDPKLAEEAIIVSAHLDHIGQRAGAPDPIFNGADDNATGVTAVTTLAYAFGALAQPPKRTVIFMTFWGEEKGLLGSKHYAANPEWPLEKTIANVNIEMVGRPEGGAKGKAWMTGWEKSNLGQLMNEGSKRVGVDIFNHPKFSAMLYRSSDNFSFAQKGVIAHSFSAGSLHDDYHGVDDEVDRLNLKHMTLVIKGLFAGIEPMANGRVTPAKSK